MARITRRREQQAKIISKFLGLNLSDVSALNLKDGEASVMNNWRLNLQQALEKRPGWEVKNALSAQPIRGGWYGDLSGVLFLLVATDSGIYSLDLTDFTETLLGACSTTGDVTFQQFGTKVYIRDGASYYSYDGTTYSEVSGYRPKIFISTPPTGGGTAFDEVNLLTGEKTQTFNGSGSATTFQVAETTIDSIDEVYVNAVLMVVSVDYSVNLTNGTVTFTVAPSNGTDNVEIQWTKDNGTRSEIVGHRYMQVFSGKTSNRMFVWGDPLAPARRYWSDIANGIPSAEYFPANSFDEVGDGTPITGMIVQYSTLKVFTQDQAYYSIQETVNVAGVDLTTFPIFNLSEEVGNAAVDQVITIENSPVTLDQGIYAWRSTAIEYQTNSKRISQKVEASLLTYDLSTAKMVHVKDKNEFWIGFPDGVVFVHNYLHKAFYKYTGIAATCFIVVDNDLLFGDANGNICRFSEGLLADNGNSFECLFRLAYMDFGAPHLHKVMSNAYITLAPQPNTYVETALISSNEGRLFTSNFKISLFSFENMDFEDFSFNTNYEPTPFYIQGPVHRFNYLSIELRLDSATKTARVLNLIFPAQPLDKTRC